MRSLPREARLRFFYLVGTATTSRSDSVTFSHRQAVITLLGESAIFAVH